MRPISNVSAAQLTRMSIKSHVTSKESMAHTSLLSPFCNHRAQVQPFYWSTPEASFDQSLKQDWQDIGEDAIQIVQLICDRGIYHKDIGTKSFIVCEDPGTEKFKVFMTSFALCSFRS
jgi:hypothetical protein